MKNLYAIFWMSCIFAGMPVIAGEESGDEDEGSGSEGGFYYDPNKAGQPQPLTFEYPRIGFGLENQPFGAEQASINVGNNSEDGSVADEDTDPDEDAVTDEELEGDDLPKASFGGAPRRGLVRRKKGVVPAYVRMWTVLKGPDLLDPEKVKKVFNQIMISLRGIGPRVKDGKLSIKTIEENLNQMQQVMPTSELYAHFNDKQKYIFGRYLGGLKRYLASRKTMQEQAPAAQESGDMFKRLKIDTGGAAAGGGGGGYQPGLYLPSALTERRRGYYPMLQAAPAAAREDLFDYLKKTLNAWMAEAKIGRIPQENFQRRISMMEKRMLNPQYYPTLSPEQRDEINALIQQARAVAQSGDLSVRSQASAGGAAAGGGGGGVEYQPRLPLPSAQAARIVHASPSAPRAAQDVAREDAFAILKETLVQWRKDAANPRISKDDLQTKIRMIETQNYSRFSPEQIQEIKLLIEQAKDQLKKRQQYA